MTLNDGADTPLVLGSNLKVQVDWSISSLTEIAFYLSECKVRHEPARDATNPTQVTVISGGCYSAALQCTRETVGVGPTRQSFSFKTFTIQGETGTGQVVACRIELCKANDCPGKTPTLADCPTTSGFDYSPNGYKTTTTTTTTT